MADGRWDDKTTNAIRSIPTPPPLPSKPSTSSNANHNCASSTATEVLDRLFDEGYRADVVIHTDGGECLYAHTSILGMVSPVMKAMLRKRKGKDRMRAISIPGVPHDAVRVFIRFIYSSRYEEEEIRGYVVHLLVLSHAFAVPRIKQKCVEILGSGYLTSENVVDILQLSLLCDAPRISLLCHRMISRHLLYVSGTDGWQAMKESHPVLEKKLLRSIKEDARMRRERARRLKERGVYEQLYSAMEALVHICRDGCRTIGPRGKELKATGEACAFAACQGLESLVRHFAGCKQRVPGGCVRCKRMWQLLGLHSRICADSDACSVPLCMFVLYFYVIVPFFVAYFESS